MLPHTVYPVVTSHCTLSTLLLPHTVHPVGTSPNTLSTMLQVLHLGFVRTLFCQFEAHTGAARPKRSWQPALNIHPQTSPLTGHTENRTEKRRRERRRGEERKGEEDQNHIHLSCIMITTGGGVRGNQSRGARQLRSQTQS